ncbi:MAG: Cof-type HAD-IIB family hydrolase [Clostridiales bacterium]|nr:Cof-type HAD-IIB family hydrolase [Clostridiales bacterium]
MKDNIKAFTQKHKEIWKFIKFTFTGASTSVLEMAVFAFLQYIVFKSLNETPVTDSAILNFLGISYKGYLYSYAISAIIGYAAAYIMNRKLTFKADADPVLSTIIYTVMVICTIIFNTWFGAFLASAIKTRGIDNFFIEMLTKLVVMTVPTLWTYPLNRFVIHRRKKQPCAVAFDLHGTLIDTNGKISQKNILSLKKMIKKGVKVIISTGRTVYEIPKVLFDKETVSYIIYSNGASVTDCYGNKIFSNSMSKEKAAEVYSFLSQYDTFIELYSDERPKCEKRQLNYDALTYFDITHSYKDVIMKSRLGCENMIDAIKNSENIEMFNVYFANQNERLIALLKLEKDTALSVTTSAENNLEIFRWGVGKGTALDTLCNKLNIEKENRYAVGDSKNDLSMFEYVNKKIAVGNACDELKAKSDKVICTNNECVADYVLKSIL